MTDPPSSSGFKTSKHGLLSRVLLPLVPVYAAAIAAKNLGYDRGWLRAASLALPVISVGNLSVGGSGKTPLVIRLAELLTQRGLAVDVLSRGYGRRATSTEQVPDPSLVLGASAGPDDQGSASPLSERYGDEPLLIAQAARIPVYVSPSRHAAGLLAEQSSSTRPGVHLLDDGFQHRQLARAVDIVLLHPSDLTQPLLPAGRLREPLSALRRASIVVLRSDDQDTEPALRRLGFDRPIWRVSREITLPAAALPGPAVAFCGIARPAEFFTSLTGAGVKLAAVHAFADHRGYLSRDIARLAASLRQTGATSLFTTAKDLVRLSGDQHAALARLATLHAVGLRASLVEQEAVIDQLLTLAGVGRPPGSTSA